MRRLLDDFAKLIDLDHRVGDQRLGELLERAIAELDEHPLPDWGQPGAVDRKAQATGPFVDFYYAPHLFPGMELKLRLAHKLQFHLLPRAVPQGAPVEAAAVLESFCHLSGDLFGWELLSDGRLLVWIVDMAGHGLRAGLGSATIRVVIRAMSSRSRIDRVVSQLNETLDQCLLDDRGTLFATGVFLTIDADGRMDYTSAGHPPVLLSRADGRLDELGATSLPIGLFPGQEFPVRQARLDPADTMLLYTDGVVEARDDAGDMFGLPRLRRFLERRFDAPRDLTRELYRVVGGHQDMSQLDDDITFVALRRRTGGATAAAGDASDG